MACEVVPASSICLTRLVLVQSAALGSETARAGAANQRRGRRARPARASWCAWKRIRPSCVCVCVRQRCGSWQMVSRSRASTALCSVDWTVRGAHSSSSSLPLSCSAAREPAFYTKMSQCCDLTSRKKGTGHSTRSAFLHFSIGDAPRQTAPAEGVLVWAINTSALPHHPHHPPIPPSPHPPPHIAVMVVVACPNSSLVDVHIDPDRIPSTSKHDYASAYARIRSAARSAGSGVSSVLVLSSPDVDAVCATRMLASLFLQDDIPHRIVPVDGYRSLTNTLADVFPPLTDDDDAAANVASTSTAAAAAAQQRQRRRPTCAPSCSSISARC